MVPARLNSKRVSRKNIRLINGKPLIGYVLETLQACEQFDAIFVNSEAEIFGDIAKHYGVNFYKRPSALSSDTATIDLKFPFTRKDEPPLIPVWVIVTSITLSWHLAYHSRRITLSIY